MDQKKEESLRQQKRPRLGAARDCLFFLHRPKGRGNHPPSRGRCEYRLKSLLGALSVHAVAAAQSMLASLLRPLGSSLQEKAGTAPGVVESLWVREDAHAHHY